MICMPAYNHYYMDSFTEIYRATLSQKIFYIAKLTAEFQQTLSF
jgi:hypothetical protein